MQPLRRFSQTYGLLAGRMLIAFIFLQSGYDKVFNFGKTTAQMASRGMPMPEVLLVLTIVIVLGGGIMILVGWQARWAALALFLFLVPSTLIFHPYWSFPEAQKLNQFHHFVKNVALMGTMLYIIAMGSGPMSLQRSSGTP